MSNESQPSIEIANQVLPVLEELELIPELLDALITKATALTGAERLVEGLAILGGSADLAANHQILSAEIRARNNLVATGVKDNEVDTRVDELKKLIDRSGNVGWLIRYAYYDVDHSYWSGQLNEAKAMVDRMFEDFDLSDFWIISFETWRWALDVTSNGAGPDELASLRELTAGFAGTDDPQIVDWVDTWMAAGAWFAGEFEEGVRAAARGGSTVGVGGYPDRLHFGLDNAAIAGDLDGAHQLIELIDRNARGRVIKGFHRYADFVVAGLEGDVDRALAEYEAMQSLWEGRTLPLRRAQTDAIAAHLLPEDHPTAIAAAHRAESWYTEHGYRVHLDVMSDTFSRYRSAEGELAG